MSPSEASEAVDVLMEVLYERGETVKVDDISWEVCSRLGCSVSELPFILTCAASERVIVYNLRRLEVSLTQPGRIGGIVFSSVKI